MRNILFFLFLCLILPVQAETLTNGYAFDSFSSSNKHTLGVSDNDPGSYSTLISDIFSNRTTSIASGYDPSLSGEGVTAQQKNGSYSFTFTPNNYSNTANIALEYSFDGSLEVPLTFSGVNVLQLEYNLNNSGPLTLNVDFDGTSNSYNLADGIGTFFIPIIDNYLTKDFTLSFGLSGPNSNFTITSPITAKDVPEPTTIASLLVLAVLLFFAYQRRRQQAHGQGAPSFAYAIALSAVAAK